MNEMKDKSVDDVQEVGAFRRFVRTTVLKKTWTRNEIVTSACLYLTILGWGVYWGAVSTTVLDLELLTNTSTSQVAVTFTFNMLGSLVGAPVGGLILSKVNNHLYMAATTLMCGLTMPTLPWARSFLSMSILTTLIGVSAGALDSGLNVTTLMVWGWDGTVFMQAYHCVFAIGTFIGPWVTKPFLAQVTTRVSNDTTLNTTLQNVTGNITKQEETFTVTGESTIMYPFMIIGLFYIANGVIYMVAYFVTRNDPAEELSRKKDSGQDKDKDADAIKPNPNQQKLWYMLPMVFMTFLRFASAVGMEVTFTSFLMPFSVKALKWKKSDGLLATTVYYGSFAGSRILAIFMAMVVSPTKMATFNTVLILTACIILSSCIHLYPVVLIVCSSLLGIGQGSLYGSSMSWASKYIHVSRKVGTIFTTGSWTGGSALPALAGHIIDSVSPMGFVYLCLGDGILLATVVLASTLMGLKFGLLDEICENTEGTQQAEALRQVKPGEERESHNEFDKFSCVDL